MNVDTLQIRLLGGFVVSVGTRTISDSEWYLRKAKTLIKVLALAANHRMHRAQLTDLLWPDMSMESASNNLHKVLHVARRVLEPSLPPKTPSAHLQTLGDTVALGARTSLDIDVEVFRALAREARSTRSPELYERAISCYGGELLPEDLYEDWALRPREQLTTTYLDLLLTLVEIREERGDIPGAIEALRLMVETDPSQEDAQAELMRLYAESGSRQLALRQYRQLCDVLQHDLDTEPSEHVEELYQRILRGELTNHSAPTLRNMSHGVVDEPVETNGLVGREDQFAVLQRAVELATQGRGGTVIVRGERGTGKSRIATTLTDWAETRGVVVLRGAAYDYRRQVPYGPITMAIESFASRIEPNSLSAFLGDIGPVIAQRVPAVALAYGNGIPEMYRPADDIQEMSQALGTLLEHLSRSTPVIMTIEDLQFADDASLRALRALAQEVVRIPVLFLCTLAEEELKRESLLHEVLTDLERQSGSQTVTLDALSPEGTERLVSQLLGLPPSAALVEAVHGVAQGSPYYTEEFVNALVGRGQLQRRNGRMHLIDGHSAPKTREQLRSRSRPAGDYRLAPHLRSPRSSSRC